VHGGKGETLFESKVCTKVFAVEYVCWRQAVGQQEVKHHPGIGWQKKRGKSKKRAGTNNIRGGKIGEKNKKKKKKKKKKTKLNPQVNRDRQFPVSGNVVGWEDYKL